MTRRKPHQWFLVIDKEAQKQFNSLSTPEKQGVFRHLQQLLESDNPYALPFVEMLQETRFANFRKFRVGDYRVFFALKSIAVLRFGHQYKGILVVAFIRHRSKAY